MNEDERACPRCAETIKKAAHVCRFCGLGKPEPGDPVPPSRSNGDWKVVLGILGAIVVFFFFAKAPATSDAPAEVADLAPIEPTEHEAVGPPVEVTVGQLVSAYARNEAAAQMEFGDKRLRVTGNVSKIDLDLDDLPVVAFSHAGDNGAAYLRFATGLESQGASLEKGKSSTFLCTKISESLGTPNLSECRLEGSR